MSFKNLSDHEIQKILKAVKQDELKQSQIAVFLMGLTMKGSTIDEIFSIVKFMKKCSVKICPKINGILIDTCGTGGGIPTINVSTAAAIITSASGIPVAKHGSRSIASRSGSADVLEKLGIKINLKPKSVEKMIEKIGIGFLYAPNFNPLMKKILIPEMELGIKTIFYTLIGPLINPAPVRAQIIGVYKQELLDVFANILKRFNYTRALVVHGRSNIDEISNVGESMIIDIKGKKIEKYTILPEELGIKRSKIRSILGRSAEYNAKIMKNIFQGKERGSKYDLVVLNAAGAFVVGGVAKDLQDGLEIARRVIDDKLAWEKLQEFKKLSKSLN